MGNKKKLITFIIPCFNSADYMNRCVDSCLNSLEVTDRFEIIIVDDGSQKDNTYEIALDYEKRYPEYIKVIHKENGGHGSAINAGLSEATGEYIKVVDSDDWLDKAALFKVIATLKKFKKQKPDLFITNFVYENQKKYHKKRVHFENVFPLRAIFGWENIGVFLVDQYILMHNVLYKRSVLESCGLKLPENMFYVDNIYVFQPLPFVKTLYYDNVNLYRYFIGRDDQSINEEIMIRRIDQHISICKTMTEILINTPPIEKKCEKYMFKYLSIMYQIATILLLVGGTQEHLEKKKALWEWFRQRDKRLYARMRFHPFGIIINMPGQSARKLLIKAYHGLGTYIGFN